jgi:integrase
MSLKEARDRRDVARDLSMKQGIDPSEEKKARKAAQADRAGSSFELVTREWFTKHSTNWAPSHTVRVIRRFERDIFPHIAKRPIGEVNAPELLVVIRKIEARGARDTAHHALGDCGQVFRYCVATSLCQRLQRPERRASSRQRGHFPAPTDPAKLAPILRAMDGYEGFFVVRCALRLAPLVFVRPGELRKAEWKDIDLEAAKWRYIASKTGTAHIVPLSRQAVEILRELHPLTGRGQYVFPGARTIKRPMCDNDVLAALRRMGIGKEKATGHGFRAAARTILDEVLNFRPDLIEHQLAHAVRDLNGCAYNRTAHLPERRKMMQQWADYLDRLKAAAEESHSSEPLSAASFGKEHDFLVKGGGTYPVCVSSDH